jgi:predicted nuclease with TOPRIM domain
MGVISELEMQKVRTNEMLQNVAEENKKVTKERDDLRREMDERQATINSLTDRISGLEKRLPNNREDNCLPLQYHNATVMFVNVKCQMSLDAGKGEIRR